MTHYKWRMTNGEEKPLTVTEAAQALGVSIRTVRRLLSRAEYGSRTEAVERHTSKGARITTLLPPDLVADLSACIHLSKGEQDQKQSGGDPEAHTGAISEADTRAYEGVPPNAATESNAATGSQGENSEAGILPAAAYRALIQSQTQTMDALRSEVEYLRGALTLAQQNLTREQALRSLPAPMPDPVTQNAPDSSPGDTQDSAKEKDSMEATAEATEDKRGGFWARLWGRAKD
jgi:hypothetical protein